MQIFLEFLVEQWILAVAWVVVMLLLLANESRKSGTGITSSQLSRMINREDGLVVDLRDAAEYKKGHITGSMNIPARDLQQRLSELNSHKNKPVIMVCKMGQQSNSSSKELKAAGFESVYKLTGGLSEWTAANLPLIKKESKKESKKENRKENKKDSKKSDNKDSNKDKSEEK